MTDLATRLAYDLTRTSVVTTAALPVPTVASVRLVSSSAGPVLVTSGRTSAGDGGGGTWAWDPTSTDSDDGALAVAVTGVTTGRWKRQYSGPIDVRWFGAVGDGVTDDTAAIQAAVDACPSGGEVLMPIGIYKVTAQIDVTADNVTIRGEGRGTQINRVFAGGAAIRFFEANSWRLRDLYVQCLLDTTGAGVGVDIDGSSHGLAEGVRVYNPRHHGIRVAMTAAATGAYYNEFRGCHVFNASVSADSAGIYCGAESNQTKISGGDYTSGSLGLYASGCESINCSGVSFEGNATAGARIGTFGGSSAGVNFSDCRFESAGVMQYGVWLDNAVSYVAIKGGFPGGEVAEIYNPRSSPFVEIGGFNPPSTTPSGGQHPYGLQTARGAKFAGMTWANSSGVVTASFAGTLKLQTTGSSPLQLVSASGVVELPSSTAGLHFVGGAGRVYANGAASALYLQGNGSGGVVVEGTGAFQTSSSTPFKAGGSFAFGAANPSAAESIAAVATDPASAMALVNDLRAKLITKGIVNA